MYCTHQARRKNSVLVRLYTYSRNKQNGGRKVERCCWQTFWPLWIFIWNVMLFWSDLCLHVYIIFGSGKDSFKGFSPKYPGIPLTLKLPPDHRQKRKKIQFVIFLSFFIFMYFCPGTMTTHAESINSDLQRGLDRRLRHTTLNTEQNQLAIKVSADN